MCSTVQEVVEKTETIILIVKPQSMKEVLIEIQPLSLDNKKFITIAMGLLAIQDFLTNIDRYQPNYYPHIPPIDILFLQIISYV
ncbi:MAG: hypothetical protein ACTSYI_15705, partial [Promethearchaeota archaeon]